MESELLKIWNKNQKLNLILLNAIPEEGMHLSVNPRGGGSVEYQFKHLYNIRFWKLEAFHKKSITDLGTVKKEEILSKEDLKDLLEITSEKIIELIHLLCTGEKKLNRTPMDLVAYFLNHEAHHRGNILLTLKLAGVKIPKEVKFELWDWGKL